MSLLISVVSHGQASLVRRLLEDMEAHCRGYAFHVLLTLNREESLPFREKDFHFPLEVLKNPKPKGFGANHNSAFHRRASDFFAVLNPDLRFPGDPFPPLLGRLKEAGVGLAAPLIVNEKEEAEDSARLLPTPWRILVRTCRGRAGRKGDYPTGDGPVHPDWVAGMFMLFPSPVFARLGGFDERYYLYFEDVDLCTRLRLAGYQILLDPAVAVVHQARRESHKKPTYLARHVHSGLLFFSSAVFWKAWRKGGRKEWIDHGP